MKPPMTEGKGFCRRRQERKAQEQLKKDLTNLDKIVIIESKDKPKNDDHNKMTPGNKSARLQRNYYYVV